MASPARSHALLAAMLLLGPPAALASGAEVGLPAAPHGRMQGPDSLRARPPEARPTLTRFAELEALTGEDEALRARAGRARTLRGWAIGSGVGAAAALVAAPFAFLFWDMRGLVTAERQHGPPRVLVALGVSAGAGGAFLGFNGAAHAEARQVAEAWNAAHPEKPISWAP